MPCTVDMLSGARVTTDAFSTGSSLPCTWHGYLELAQVSLFLSLVERLSIMNPTESKVGT